MDFNIVELVTAGDNDCAFDQRCKFGHRVEGHAVYCHNAQWEDSPRKCRRTRYTDGKIKDEDCPGFEANPEFKGSFDPSPIKSPLCTKCYGSRCVLSDGVKMGTCPLCMGSGSQPTAMKLSTYEQNTLELGSLHGSYQKHPFVRIAEDDAQNRSIDKLCELALVTLRSMSHTRGSVVYLLESTMKGQAVMRANWEATKGG